MIRLPFPCIILHPPKYLKPHSNLASNSLSEQFIYLLKNCSSSKQFSNIHAQILLSGLHNDPYLLDLIIHFSVFHRFGSMSYGRLVIEQSQNSLPSSWNNLIRGYATANTNLQREAFWVFLSMRRSQTKPNALTYPFLFKSCAVLSSTEGGRQIQADVLKHGVDSDVYVRNTLIHFYGSCRKVNDARLVFDEMSIRSVVSWNSVISAFVENLRFNDAVEYFVNMRNSGYEPDETTMVVLLSACTRLGNLTFGKWIHSQTIEKGLLVNCQLGTALVDMYAKCGAVDFAGVVFDKMLERNVWTWSAMILGLAQHGFSVEALTLFKRMKISSIKPNYVTFLGVLCACSHGGLVNEAQRFFHEMEHVHKIKPAIIHHGAMVDVLSRAGLLNEAYAYISNMPINPDATVWRTLLCACNIHDVNDCEGVREKVRNRLLELEPKRGENFVMIANNYAEVGLWDKAVHLRNKMRNIGLKKVAGESCIDVDGSIFRFFSGYNPHIAWENIILLLDQLSLHMRTLNDLL